MSYKFILASSSPRRQDLIKILGIPFEVKIPEIDETLNPALTLSEQCLILSKEKANKVKDNYTAKVSEGVVILAADTLVGIHNKKLEKPIDNQDAQKMLQLLAGKTHQVVTGICIVYCHPNLGWKEFSTFAQTAVTFHDIPQSLRDIYIDSGDGMDKAGGYGLQGFAQCFVKSIQGTYSNVVGLPIDLVVQFLDRNISTGNQNWKNLFL